VKKLLKSAAVVLSLAAFWSVAAPTPSANAWPGSCPNSAPCSRNSQCDTYCGHVGWGVCGSGLCCICAG